MQPPMRKFKDMVEQSPDPFGTQKQKFKPIHIDEKRLNNSSPMALELQQPAKSNGPFTFMEDRIKNVQEKSHGTAQVYDEKFDRIGRRLALADQLILEAQETKKELAELRLQEIQTMSTEVDLWFKDEKEKREQQDNELEKFIEGKFLEMNDRIQEEIGVRKQSKHEQEEQVTYDYATLKILHQGICTKNVKNGEDF